MIRETGLHAEQMVQEEGYFFPYHYLDLKVDEYRHIYHAEYLHVLKSVRQIIAPLEGKSVLDFGCGDGRFVYEIRKEAGQVVGVDYSQRAISFARAFNPGVEFHARDISMLELSGRFDYIVMIETLEHIVPAEIPPLLGKLRSMLKNYGKLIVTVPSTNVPLIDKHFQHFTADSLAKAVAPAFIVCDCLGYSRIALSRKFHTLARLFGTYAYPLLERLGIAERYFGSLNTWWRARYGLGKPSECAGLIAICAPNDLQDNPDEE